MVQGEWVVKNNTVDSKTNRETETRACLKLLGNNTRKKISIFRGGPFATLINDSYCTATVKKDL